MKRKEIYLILGENPDSEGSYLVDTAFTSFEEAQRVAAEMFNRTGKINQIKAIYLDSEKHYAENPIPTPYCACCGVPMFDSEQIEEISGIRLCKRCHKKFLEKKKK